ncbi:3-isopropylmalate dehydratase small subunit [Sphingobium sp.]|uniref:3-isopropylmalate dehydratase small subunit n=1 Tax=Sphingobium sp. TaxID=1912891 RepID=UPI0028BD1FAB|nr:3-isopropylmalate dehydratase small subunit [Sphingobium sp.]
MEAFTSLTAIAAPLPLANVDTDKILPARFLTTIQRAGLGKALFASLRIDDDFVLNKTPWNEARILVAGDNFGCGSSREHAPWALLDFGIRCVIAPGIADIFYNNCFKNGILPIVLPEAEVEELMRLASDAGSATMSVDLVGQTIEAGGRTFAFEVDPKRKHDLLGGIDEISDTLVRGASIDAFEANERRMRPWQPQISLAALA